MRHLPLLLMACGGPVAPATTATTRATTPTTTTSCGCSEVIVYEVAPVADGQWCALHELADDEVLVAVAEEKDAADPVVERWAYDSWRWEVRDRSVGFQAPDCGSARHLVTVAIHR